MATANEIISIALRKIGVLASGETASAEDVMSLTLEAWKKGIKTLYYQHNVNSAQEMTKNLLTCSSCEA